jgi:hypothetical protein
MRGGLLAAVALGLLGCAGPGQPVNLAIRDDPFTPNCHTSFTIGLFIPDDDMGTAIVEDVDQGGRTIPVRWPEGFSARRLGSVIEVRNQDGAVLAQTGNRYKFLGGYGDDAWRGCDGVIPNPGRAATP